MFRYVLPLLIAVPALAEEAPHTGVAGSRSMPELSDLALFVFAAFSVWFVRRAMRARFRKTAEAEAQD